MEAAQDLAMSPQLVDGCSTIPGLFRKRATELADKVALREKDFGIWNEYTWADWGDQARLAGLGLRALGMARGDVPLHFGDDMNIRWKVDVPGRGFSTPVVWGDRMFLTTAVPTGAGPADVGGEEFHGGGGPQAEQSFEVYCLDRLTGETIWRRVAKVETPYEGYHRLYGSFASHSPVTDGKRLYVSFGSFGLYCYDLDGKLIWEKDHGIRMKMRRQFGQFEASA